MKEEFRVMITYDLSDTPRYDYRVAGPEYFDWVFSEMAKYGPGVTILWRVNLAGRCYYHSRHMTRFDRSCIGTGLGAEDWHKVARSLEVCDPLAEAVRAARRHGINILAWFNIAEFQCYRGSVNLIDPIWYERPTKYWSSRDGSQFYHGIPYYGDRDVQDRLLAIIEELTNYGSDGIYISTRTHSWQPGLPVGESRDFKKNPVVFGFNKPVVDAYRERYGVDIRFEDFDEEKWHRIKGEHFTDLLWRMSRIIKSEGQEFIVGITPDRYSLTVSPCHAHESCRLYKEWERWVNEEIVDGIAAETSCPHESLNNTADISLFKETLAMDTKLYPWSDSAWFQAKGGGAFSLLNWNARSIEEVTEQVKTAKDTGAAGTIVHSLYWFFFIDSQGGELGIGKPPRREYWQALKIT